MDGGDVGVGEESQFTQVFVGADLRAEEAGGGGVFEIAAVHGLGKIEVVRDQEANGVGFDLGDSEM